MRDSYLLYQKLRAGLMVGFAVSIGAGVIGGGIWLICSKNKSPEQMPPSSSPTVLQPSATPLAAPSPTPLPTPIPSSEPPVPSDTETTGSGNTQTIRIVAMGDNLIHWSTLLSGDRGDGTYNYDHLYNGIQSYVSSADFAIANQEVPMGGPDLGFSTYPTFNVPFQFGDALNNAGFDCMTMATNHCLDAQAPGIINMLTYMRTNLPGILTTGVYLSEEERNTIPIADVNGFKIAVLNYTYGTNGMSVSQSYMVNYLNKDQIASDITKARQQADFVIVCPHWGEENQIMPNAGQMDYNRFFADCGADLVIGNHPHVVQPYTSLTNCDGEKMYTFFSLGNMISQQDYTRQMLGGAANVLVTYDEQTHHVTDVTASLDFTMTSFQYDPAIPAYSNIRTMMWSDYTPEQAATHGLPARQAQQGIYDDIPFSYEQIAQLVSSLQSERPYAELQP